MAIIAGELVRQSLIMAQIVDPEESPNATYLSQGMLALNNMLQDFSEHQDMTPYLSELSFTLTPTKRIYTVGPDSSNDIITPEVADFTEIRIRIDTNTDGTEAWQPVTIIDAFEFNNRSITYSGGYPTSVYILKQGRREGDENGYSKLDFPTSPSTPREVRCLVKEKYPVYTEFEDITGRLPTFMMKYARYQLSSDLADIFGTELGLKFHAELNRLRSEFLVRTIKDNRSKTNGAAFGSYATYGPKYGWWYSGR